jgi:hypothetical protein
MQWTPHHQQYSPSYPSHFSPQAYQNNQAQAPVYYQSYHYATTNHPQPLLAPQITYSPTMPQITYPLPNNTNPQVKTKVNPPPPPLPQIQEPPQQPDTFPTHGTILTITKGSNTDFDINRQHRDYYQQINHVEGLITQTKLSYMPITFSAQDVNLASFPHTDAMVITIHIDRWDITKILIDNGSQTEILFLTTFEKMGF